MAHELCPRLQQAWQRYVIVCQIRSGRGVADAAVYTIVVVEEDPSSQHVIGVSQVGECVLPADDALDDAVI